jgi:hypothetical protein
VDSRSSNAITYRQRFANRPFVWSRRIDIAKNHRTKKVCAISPIARPGTDDIVNGLVNLHRAAAMEGGLVATARVPKPGDFDFVGPIKPRNWDALTGHPDGHAFSVHGGSVTDPDLQVRATTGVKPNGDVSAVPPISSAFHTDSLLIYADDYIRESGALQRAIVNNPGKPVVQVTTKEVGNIGIDLGRGYVRVGATGNPQFNSTVFGPLQRLDGLNSAQGWYQFSPSKNLWETITVYPAPFLP